MSPHGNGCSGDTGRLTAGPCHRLFFHGTRWAQASLNPDADAVTIGCMNPHDPAGVQACVKVVLLIDRPLACTVDACAVKSWPTSARKVLERLPKGAEQLLGLVDMLGRPWAEIEIGDQVHLFDPSGRERARILRTWSDGRGQLTLRCWNELGQEVTADESLPA